MSNNIERQMQQERDKIIFGQLETALSDLKELKITLLQMAAILEQMTIILNDMKGRK